MRSDYEPMLVEHRGLPRDATSRERMQRQAEWFGAHRDDRIVEE